MSIYSLVLPVSGWEMAVADIPPPKDTSTMIQGAHTSVYYTRIKYMYALVYTLLPLGKHLLLQ